MRQTISVQSLLMLIEKKIRSCLCILQDGTIVFSGKEFEQPFHIQSSNQYKQLETIVADRKNHEQ
jgi:hypothetical protein